MKPTGLDRRYRVSLSLVFLGLLLPLASMAVGYAEGDSPEPDFPSAEFYERARVVDWLLEYDAAAWKSSDAAMEQPEEERKQLGTEWYCLKMDDSWNCYYGKYNPAADRFQVVFHFRQDSDDVYQRVKSPFSEEGERSLVRALYNSRKLLPEEIQSSGVRMNQYLRRVEDDRIEVWYLPAFQFEGMATLGGDYCYVYDSSGKKLLERRENHEDIRLMKLDGEVVAYVDNEEKECPEVGDIFFFCYYRQYFDDIFIMNSKTMTGMIQSREHGSAWIHAVRGTMETLAAEDVPAEGEEP